MSQESVTGELPEEQDLPEDQLPDDEAGEEAKTKLTLEVSVDKPSACQRHITVTISRDDISRYLDDAYGKLVPKAEVRGFRAGRAPRKLVESFYKEQVREQVKGSLLLDSLQQISEDHDFSAISEPDFKYQAVELPDDGPLTFEFDLEVRPEFDMPNWKGLEITRPTHEVSDQEVNQHLISLLARWSRVVPVEGDVQADDYVTVKMTFTHNGQALSTSEEESVRVKPKLNFPDGWLEGFDKLIIGAKAGDKRTGKVHIGDAAKQADLAGKEVDVEFEIVEVKRVEPPNLSQSFLDQLGMQSEDELRTYTRKDLERRVQYQQQQQIRQQITDLLTANANWDLPPDLLKRQARRELDRAVLELQSSGYSTEEIEAHANYLRRNVAANTARALREHFILERIAEEHEIDASDEDYNREIALIAQHRNESARRIRARLEKRGQMDTLRNQIIERRVIDLVTTEAKFKEVPLEMPASDAAAVQHSICGAQEESEIPEAQGGEAEELRQPVDHK